MGVEAELRSGRLADAAERLLPLVSLLIARVLLCEQRARHLYFLRVYLLKAA